MKTIATLGAGLCALALVLARAGAESARPPLPTRGAAGVDRDVQDALDAAKARRPAAPEASAAGDPLSALDPRRAGAAAQFIRVDPGSFDMGSPPEEAGRFEDETLHKVTLTRPYELQATEVTQLQFVLVTGRNPAFYSRKEDCPERFEVIEGVQICPDHPVTQVPWKEVQQQFIDRLNELQREYAYRLPTEAEWEYAARAGVSTVTRDARTLGTGQPKIEIHSVTAGAPNAWGFYGMDGNAWEWTQDWYSEYPRAAVADPTGPASGTFRVFRGGTWGRFEGVRPAQRYSVVPEFFCRNLGFRLARSRR